ncbi:MAG: immunoglobulin domain-containing protein, partial [Verrucomicrobia bacterium]
MNIRKYASLGLAVVLQVLPLTRVVVATTPAMGSSYAIIATWIAGVTALMGGIDAVSGASTTITSPTSATGTNGVAFSYRISTGPQAANTFAASPLPPGLIVSTTTGRITGTPTTTGVYLIGLTASDSGIANRTITTNLTLTIIAGGVSGGTAPSFTTQPTSQTVTAGANVNFNVTASGTAPLSYQWRLNGANISGATSATLA